MDLDQVKEYLSSVKNDFKTRKSDSVEDYLINAKKEFVKKDSQEGAKEIWILEQIFAIHNLYITAFNLLKAGNFYDAWCTFEQVELKLQFLSPHFDISSNSYELKFIDQQTELYQSIYPYKYFLSPEFVEKEKVCTICGKRVSIRNSCGHRVGEIYDGEMCTRTVKKTEVLGLAIVESPVQKYSVPFMKDEKTGEIYDHYNYHIVQYLIDRLESPFDGWKIEWQERSIPHSKYPEVGRNDKCPCESGKKYKKCCLNERGILRPHCEFIFEKEPPAHLNTIEYNF